MFKVKILISLLFAFILSGCFSTQSYTYQRALAPHQLYTNTTYKSKNISEEMIEYFKEWEGVPYKYAGNSKNGVDCSYFVQDAFKRTLNIKIPRTTKYQAKTGYKVQNLQTGDLVFFKTGFKQRHVGIYLDKGHFMHVSTKKGVIISRLDNPYWHRHYWKTQRIIK